MAIRILQEPLPLQVRHAYRSSVGKKVAMAASGAVLVLWVIAHMVGNLKAFQGPDEINRYAEGLRTLGAPVVGESQVLWLVRVLLLLAAVIHVWAAAQLTLLSRAARPVGYHRAPHQETSYASRTMRWGGVILLLYVVYHLMHFTFGNVHPSFRTGDVYHNLVAGFQAWPVVVTYVAATLALSFHLHHGVWSALQTLGASHPQYDRHRRSGAAVVSVAVFLGFVSVPIAVFAGVIG